jgi:hypothetical protein
MWNIICAGSTGLSELGSVFWRAIYSIGLTILCALGLVLIPQGVECLRLVSAPGWNFPVFLLAVLSWSLAAWYSARLTLGRRFRGRALVDRSGSALVRALRTWLPRLLGVLPATLLAIAFWRQNAIGAALACAAMALLVAVFVLQRRRWFARQFGGGHGLRAAPAALGFDALPAGSVRTVAGAIALSFLLLAAIWWKPVEVGAIVTAPALLCFAFASWILFGDLVLTYWFKQGGLPSMAALPALLFVLCSVGNDNHNVHLIAGDGGPSMQRALGPHMDDWLAARAASGELTRAQPYPLVLVAAEGGGLRAAYWSASVLAKLQDESAARFGRHVFALSGVSGGSLANAMFVALMAEQRNGALGGAPCARGVAAARFQACARQMLRRDFLSPVLGYLLYPDLLQRFLPLPIGAADRARAMEAAWRAGWTEALGGDRFGQRFDQLWHGAGDVEIPSLLLNATLVDGGNRFIASDLVVNGQFPDAFDGFDALLDTRQMSLATAVHNSARFTYLSPAGTVASCRDERDGVALVACRAGLPRAPWGRVIDGGYFENSGVETVRDLLFGLRPTLARWREAGFVIEPLVLVISNSPRVRAPAGHNDPRRARLDTTLLSEVLAPLLGLFNTRIARASFAVSAASRDLAAGATGAPVGFYWFGMMSAQDTPLGWALAADSFDGMDALLAPSQATALPFEAVLHRLAPGTPAPTAAPPR